MGETEMTYEEVRAWEIESHKIMLEECAHPEGESRVYCILNIACDAVKIGTTTNVRRRLQQLQTASPDRLYLHYHIRGGLSKERELHQRYARFRRVGEWFYDPDGKIAGDFTRLFLDDLTDGVVSRQRGLA